MSASLFFVLLFATYFSHDMHPKSRQIISVLCLAIAVYFAIVGK